MHEFDELLRTTVDSGGDLDLPSLVARSFGIAREDQLTVAVILGDFAEVHERLSLMAGSRLIDSVLTPSVGVLGLLEAGETYTVSVWRSAPGVSAIVGVPPVTDERWRRVERWLRALEPRVASVFLDEEDFEGICEGLTTQGRVEVSRLAARVLADGSSWTRGWPEDRVFERPTYSEAIAEVTGFASIRTLTLHVSDRLMLHLRRSAGATFYSGDFGLFHDVVFTGLVDAARRRHELLVNRQRTPGGMPTSALSVELGIPVFGQPEALQQLLSELTDQHGMGVAVLHRNPYLHLAVTDYVDGSNFDVFVTSDSELTIFPGYRATVGSLARTADAIGDRFAAVAIGETPSARPPTREDLFTTG